MNIYTSSYQETIQIILTFLLYNESEICFICITNNIYNKIV